MIRPDHGVAVDQLDEGEQVGLASTPSRPQVHIALEQALNKDSARPVGAGVQKERTEAGMLSAWTQEWASS